jgi:hypothetical protein
VRGNRIGLGLVVLVLVTAVTASWAIVLAVRVAGAGWLLLLAGALVGAAAALRLQRISTNKSYLWWFVAALVLSAILSDVSASGRLIVVSAWAGFLVSAAWIVVCGLRSRR